MPDIQTLILFNAARMVAYHGEEAAQSVLNAVQKLAAHLSVSGVILPVRAVPADDPNATALAIRDLVWRLLPDYPAVEHILIIGHDEIIPFYRVRDAVELGMERDYPINDPEIGDSISPDSALGRAVAAGQYLTDDLYASLKTQRGRPLLYPELSVGRLVETSAQIIAAIEAYLRAPTVTVRTAQVIADTFLLDIGRKVADQLTGYGIQTERLISNAWAAEDLTGTWLTAPRDLTVLASHSQHNSFVAPKNGALVMSDEVAAGADMTGRVVLGIGCHLGLNVPNDSNKDGRDIVEALVGRGAAVVAPTAYAYGDTTEVRWSERLLTLLLAQIAHAEDSLGSIVRAAKQAYIAAQRANFDAYDGKVVAAMTLYGVPTLRLAVPKGG